MMLTIATSGGIGGFGLGKERSVAVGNLPTPLRQEVCDQFTEERLAKLAATSAQRGADRLTYVIGLDMEDGKPVEYRLDEAAMPPEMLDLIDTMLHTGE
ncbi:protealysin inhibitor emfourin [Albidovulum aquaemixtae]|nr:protealysin inhibitor emfourin [Defluviimonas aquaemixtae]